MKNLRLLLAIFCLSFIVFSISCEDSVEEDQLASMDDNDDGNGDDGNQDSKCNSEISFSNDVQPIINDRCIGCHMQGANPPLLTNFANIKSSAASVQTQVVNRTMPIGSTLTNDQIELIDCWIKNGALEN